jgi:F420-non-reducing hydrogenase iron-sulfur subunit
MSTALNEKTAGYEPLIVAFCCNWCSYAGGDLAGTSRMSTRPMSRLSGCPAAAA